MSRSAICPLVQIGIIIGALALNSIGAQAQAVITTVAGTDFVFNGDGKSALQAPINPQAVVLDQAGNLLIADSGNNRILKVVPDGTLVTVAGNGIAGFSGDGGAAVSAALNRPNGVAVDTAGNVFVADTDNARIRVITPDGTIRTVAGNGSYQSAGDGGLAVNASLIQPLALAVDRSGNIYIADASPRLDGSWIRKVTPAGIINTLAGNGTQGFSGDGGPANQAALNFPTSVTVDSAGNVYIADHFNFRVRKVTPAGIITTVAGTQAGLYPYGVAVDSADNLYISTAYQIYMRAADGTLHLVAGTGGSGYSGDGAAASQALLNSPNGMAIDASGNLYVADAGNEVIRRVTKAGTISTVAGNRQFSFSGDGGPATSAALNFPGSVALDATGNLAIGDDNNDRIRKVGVAQVPKITTFAGNGIRSYGGDGGPANLAPLNLIYSGVAFDTAGNLYISDFNNGRLRKVTPQGIINSVDTGGVYPTAVAVDRFSNLYVSDSSTVQKITPGGIRTTIAGNGTPGYCGDGGAATSACLNQPSGLAVDAEGSVYIADQFNNRVRKVDPAGIITTVAGRGNEGFTGDGGPATAATVTLPIGIAVDASGNLYIADYNFGHVREVSTDGVITTIAGRGGNAQFSGDGGPAINASVGNPRGIAVDSAGNIYIADSSQNRIREILATAPFFAELTSSETVLLSAPGGGKAATGSLQVLTSVNSTGSAVPGMSYTSAVTAGASWLSVTPPSGNTPGLLTIKADPLVLEPGNYTGAITITVPLANPSVRSVNVQFTVTAAIPPTLSLDQSHMSFTYATTSAARSQTLIVANTGGGSLNFITSIVLNSGVSANWLSVVPQIGTATPGNPVSLAVTADPSKLGPGTYTASLTVNAGSAGSATIPITMTITTNPLVMLLSQAGLTFTAIQNGGVIPAQTFGVLNLGSGTLNWTVQTLTLTGGNWLSATPSSGASASADVNGAPLVSVSVNPAGLAPGVYYGLVKVISAGAANTPQEVVAVLQVLQAGSDVAPIVQPTSLIFTAPAGVSSPSSQNVLVYDPTGTSKSFSSTASGAGSLVTLPTDATIPPAEPVQVVVQPVVNGLNPGTYPGTLTLQFSDGRVSAVGVTFVVTSGSTAASENPREIPHDSGSCTPTKLIPVLTTLGQGFNVPAGYPEGLTVQVTDDCGNPLTEGQVSVEFSTGQGLKYMQSLNNGRWDVTWNTGSQSSAVTLTVHATHPTLPIKGDAQITGALGALLAPPQVADRGVVSSASFTATPVAPGGFISIFGSLLSDATSSAQVLPLPTMLNNTTVKLGDLTLPLFYTNNGATSQLNALVPYETPLNTNQQLLVQRDNTYATPVYVDVAAAQPGVLEYGNQEAVAVDMNGNLIGPSNPAHAGDLLTMYCLGLGAVSPAVADGAAAPSNPPASTANTVTVTVGGQTANVYFAGLTPTLAGLYQIDFYVPQNSGTGDQVPVVLSTAGQTSVAVNLSVR